MTLNPKTRDDVTPMADKHRHPSDYVPSGLQSSRQARSEHIRSIPKDIILTLITCGLFNIYVQSRQIKALNAMLKEKKYSFGLWFLLTLITCGIYHIYHEYRTSSDLVKLCKLENHEPILCVMLTVFGLGIITDAIEQTHINHYYGDKKL